MSFVEILILAVVQGLTEFLPVSSSGHLVVTNALLEAFGKSPTQDLVEVNIVLHLGTLLAVLAFYWKEISRLLGTDRRALMLLAIGTLPAVAIGLPIKMKAEHILESPLLAGLMFPVTAFILVWASRQPEGDREYWQLRKRDAVGIGFMQALALLPGISRSGSTIAGGLFSNLTRESAGTFAFLLAIPVIGGPGLIEVVKLMRDAGEGTAPTGTQPWVLGVGAVVAFVVGYAALWQLVRWVRRGKLAAFAWYLVPLGVAVTAWQLTQ